MTIARGDEVMQSTKEKNWLGDSQWEASWDRTRKRQDPQRPSQAEQAILRIEITHTLLWSLETPRL
jgi:SOS response regulatory protein OraA/RecX